MVSAATARLQEIHYEGIDNLWSRKSCLEQNISDFLPKAMRWSMWSFSLCDRGDARYIISLCRTLKSRSPGYLPVPIKTEEERDVDITREESTFFAFEMPEDLETADEREYYTHGESPDRQPWLEGTPVDKFPPVYIMVLQSLVEIEVRKIDCGPAQEISDSG